jgi:ribosomal protein RSM22 (predicted rRNA methylase)
VQLNPVLRARLDEICSQVERDQLVRAADEISAAYRNHKPLTWNAARRAAYLQVRLPATLAAVRAVLKELREHSNLSLTSMLDLGAGIGVATLAALEEGIPIQHATLWEQDREWLRLSNSLFADTQVQIQHQALDLRQNWPSADADLCVASYCLNELSATEKTRFVAEAWQRSGKLLVFVEPGTPTGFQNILAARQWLINQDQIGNKAHIVAPCPHHQPCPMASAENAGKEWCHFAQRIERTREHRQLKQADLGHEDEKFSYLIASKTESTRAGARIVRHPLHLANLIQVQVCGAAGLETLKVARRDEARFKAARKSRWGGEL